jgi:RNA polymerase sigma-70 factor, ECF subfamily
MIFRGGAGLQSSRMTTAPIHTAELQRTLLAAARDGDEEAFRGLLEPHRGGLHAHCYRMLGSVQDAEDALQDSLVRAWRGLPRFEERSSLRNWLFRIATNTCLNIIERSPPRHLPIGYGQSGDPFASEEVPLVESVWIDPYPDAELGVADGFASPAARYERRESLELAFVAALQLLPAGQRAALIMREVLGFSAREVAEALGTTVASVNSSLQRARKALARQLPEQSQREARRVLGERELEQLVRRYADAMERADIDAVVAMLTEDATWSMPPWSSWFDGPAAISRFLRDHALNGVTWRHVATSANGQAAVGCYLHSSERACYVPGVIDVLTIRGDRIATVTAFVTPEIFPRFALPESLPLRGDEAP